MVIWQYIRAQRIDDVNRIAYRIESNTIKIVQGGSHYGIGKNGNILAIESQQIIINDIIEVKMGVHFHIA